MDATTVAGDLAKDRSTAIGTVASGRESDCRSTACPTA